MKTYIKNDLKRTYLVLEAEEGEKEDYQSVMLKENHIPGILKTDVRYIDNQIHYYYNISGKRSLMSAYEKTNLEYKDMKNLVVELMEAIRNLQKYMLDGNSILLEPEYIFCDREHYFFCYYPTHKNHAQEEFHQLTEFFVREVNYNDEQGVYFAYTFHKATMEENYSIEEIMKNFVPEPAIETEENSPEDVVVEYIEHMENQELEEEIAEHTNFWGRTKKFFEKVKSRYLDEDDKYL